jgi:Holliday junction resolvase RusA-like endonuclease
MLSTKRKGSVRDDGSGFANARTGLIFTGVIHAAPRTKKTSNRVVRAGRFTKVLPSANYKAFESLAVPQLRQQYRGEPIQQPVNCRALFLRDALRGDAVGYYQALADTLEAAGIVANDKFIVQWDGSRLDKDAANPRIIFTLEAV